MDEWAEELPTRHLSSVLEVGYGTGQLVFHMVDAGFDVAAIDLSPGNVSAAVARGVQASVGGFAVCWDRTASPDRGVGRHQADRPTA